VGIAWSVSKVMLGFNPLYHNSIKWLSLSLFFSCLTGTHMQSNWTLIHLEKTTRMYFMLISIFFTMEQKWRRWNLHTSWYRKHGYRAHKLHKIFSFCSFLPFSFNFFPSEKRDDYMKNTSNQAYDLVSSYVANPPSSFCHITNGKRKPQLNGKK